VTRTRTQASEDEDENEKNRKARTNTTKKKTIRMEINKDIRRKDERTSIGAKKVKWWKGGEDECVLK